MTVQFTPDRLSHSGDPEVSKIAAISLNGSRTEQAMHAIVNLLEELGPQTPAELEHVYRSRAMVNRWPLFAWYSIHKRASQMKVHIRILKASGIREGGAERLELAVDPLVAHAKITAHMQGGDDE